MGRINVRVDEDLLEEVDSQGDVRSEVVRDALKNYLGFETKEEGETLEGGELNQVVEEVVDKKIEEDVYPRLGNIYEKLDEAEVEDHEKKRRAEVQVELDKEVYEFYDNYTRAFETPLSEIVADLLEEEAYELSEKLGDVSHTKPSWVLENTEKEGESE